MKKTKILFARKCSECGCGMNEGYVVRDGELYLCSKCLGLHFSPEQWEEETEDIDEGGNSYWTEWNDKSDFEYELVDGEITEIRQ